MMMYNAPVFLFNAHLETIFPSIGRRVSLQPYFRERITTPDNDFLDLDWLRQGSEKLVIISHGLEGNTSRPYVKGLAKAAFENGFDVLAWNFRGCSEEMNQQMRFYHSGATDDLEVVIQHAIGGKVGERGQHYKVIYLSAFSLGGNLTLKYLGEKKTASYIRRAVVFSVPLHLESSCEKISRRSNWIYANRFLRSLKEKVIAKNKLFPELDVLHLDRIKTIQAFDDRYTAPLHGYRNAADYYEQCSAISFLGNIEIPTLIINAQNDPFLSEKCYPVEALKHHPNIRFENPARGGHVGFAQFGKQGMYWSEERAIAFLTEGARM